MEIWGGIECTFNRVKGHFVDQLARSGHLERNGDLSAIAALGIRTLRYPIHWERVQPLSPAHHDWAFPARQMSELATLKITPIVGLLHHGSGPVWTNLLEANFPRHLADYAGAVARRFPQVRDYTPVNEPLTTARFSALYGHWYPHRTDDTSFVKAFLNEIEGTIRAMEAIRAVRSDARLIQTEDIAKVFSTPALADQASFENERRWLTFDMLTGRFNDRHPLWSFFLDAGADRAQMDFIAANACPPHIVGVNYYVTSERCLDEDLGRYPLDTHGGNGRQSYADVAAVQGCPERVRGVEKMVQEVWDRYGLPLAITESHLGCTRDEQVRWLMESWRAGQNLCRRGVDLRAVTAWALLGAFDWNSLVTTEVGVYEPGAFDVRSGQLRPTLLAKVIQQLAQTRRFEHPILCDAGWWHRAECQNRPAAVLPHFGRPILILGGAGNLARALERVCHVRGLSCRNLSRHQADVCQLKSLQRCLEIYRPWAVVNASGYTFIEEAETDRDRCFEVNEVGARNAARVCAAAGIPYVAISSDLVFGGEKMEPYVESDEMRPRSVFGMSKQQGERAVLGVYSGALVIRTSTLFDPWSLGHFAAQVLLQESPLILPEGRISPTFTVDLCQGLLDLLIDDESGVWHLANEGSVTWVEFAQRILEAFSLPARELHGKAPVAPRPQQSVLRSEKGSLMPSLDDAVVRFARDFQPMLGTAGRHEAAVG